LQNQNLGFDQTLSAQKRRFWAGKVWSKPKTEILILLLILNTEIKSNQFIQSMATFQNSFVISILVLEVK
jgi:hypothetical protein